MVQTSVTREGPGFKMQSKAFLSRQKLVSSTYPEARINIFRSQHGSNHYFCERWLFFFLFFYQSDKSAHCQSRRVFLFLNETHFFSWIRSHLFTRSLKLVYIAGFLKSACMIWCLFYREGLVRSTLMDNFNEFWKTFQFNNIPIFLRDQKTHISKERSKLNVLPNNENNLSYSLLSSSSAILNKFRLME